MYKWKDKSDEIGQKQIKGSEHPYSLESLSLGLVPTPKPLSPRSQWSAIVLKDGLAERDLRGRYIPG